MAIPGCCPAVRPARGGTGRWRRWSRGAMSCSTTPNAACWPACRCCAAGSTSARPNGWPPAGRCSQRRSPGCWPAWPASPSCTSMTAPRSVIRCWRPSASSPPAGWPPPARKRPCTCGCWTGRWTRPGRRRRPWAAPDGRRGPAACQPGRTAFALRCRGRWAAQEPEAGRELAARLARWWIATGRYSEAGQFLTTAAGIPSAGGSRHPGPGAARRCLVGVPPG